MHQDQLAPHGGGLTAPTGGVGVARQCFEDISRRIYPLPHGIGSPLTSVFNRDTISLMSDPKDSNYTMKWTILRIDRFSCQEFSFSYYINPKESTAQ